MKTKVGDYLRFKGYTGTVEPIFVPGDVVVVVSIHHDIEGNPGYVVALCKDTLLTPHQVHACSLDTYIEDLLFDGEFTYLSKERAKKEARMQEAACRAGLFRRHVQGWDLRTA